MKWRPNKGLNLDSNINVSSYWSIKIIKKYCRQIGLSCCFFFFVLFCFFNCYLALPRPTLGHSQRDSLTNPMLIMAFVHVRSIGHQESRNKVDSLSPAKHLASFEPETFRFWLQHLNPLGHSPQKLCLY